LKALNSNTENPYLIWENGTRAELTDFLEKQQTHKINGVRVIVITGLGPGRTFHVPKALQTKDEKEAFLM
jgi:hypothetical protein